MRNILFEAEGKSFDIHEREWDEYHGITAAVITMNEEDYIVDFLKHIRPVVDRIVMIDGGSVDNTVALAMPYVDSLKVEPFRGHFADQKNEALKMCRTDWVLFMDPDERMEDGLFNSVPSMINQNEIDCYKFPRREIIDGVEDESVYPDYQARLFRTYCRFVRPIHEEVVGCKNIKEIDKVPGMNIIHAKKSERHTERNGEYPMFALNFMHEWGKPGHQTKETEEKPLDILMDREAADKDKDGE